MGTDRRETDLPQTSPLHDRLRALNRELMSDVEQIYVEAGRFHPEELPVLERMLAAVGRLAALIEELARASHIAVEEPARWPALRGHLRHDLRTPLNAVKGYGDMLLEDWRDSGAVEQAGEVTKALKIADLLLVAIDELGEPLS